MFHVLLDVFSNVDVRFSCRQVAEPEVRYDPVRLEEQLFKQPVKWLVRNVELFLPLGTFVGKVILDIQVRTPKDGLAL